MIESKAKKMQVQIINLANKIVIIEKANDALIKGMKEKDIQITAMAIKNKQFDSKIRILSRMFISLGLISKHELDIAFKLQIDEDLNNTDPNKSKIILPSKLIT